LTLSSSSITVSAFGSATGAACPFPPFASGAGVFAAATGARFFLISFESIF